jgi:hypothetical protein
MASRRSPKRPRRRLAVPRRKQNKYVVSSTRPYAARPMTDVECELMAHAFLEGFWRQADGQLTKKWLKGEHEALGREALIRILASEKPVPDFVRQGFVNVLDLGNREPRELVFKFRSQNWRHYIRQDADVASYIEWHLQYQKMTNPNQKPLLKVAFDDARRVSGLKDRTIFHAWAAHRKQRPIDLGAAARCG